MKYEIGDFAVGMRVEVRNFNRAIIHLAPPFEARASAPDGFAELCELMSSVGRMIVWSGGSAETIYRDPRVNHAFRAWHDTVHWQGKLPFTPEGEAEVCRRQILELFRKFGDNPETRRWAALLDAEINGQVEYWQRHGEFPEDQVKFDLEFMQQKEAA